MATPKSLNAKIVDNPLSLPMNLVTPLPDKQNDSYDHQKTAVWHIAIEGRRKFHARTAD
jgi:hypothetical protein